MHPPYAWQIVRRYENTADPPCFFPARRCLGATRPGDGIRSRELARGARRGRRGFRCGCLHLVRWLRDKWRVRSTPVPPADIVILAAPVWMDWLQERGILGDAPQTYLLGNRLVLVAPADSTIAPDPGNLAASLGDMRLVIGQRDAVPAGIYAREWLQATKQWEALQNMLAETDNVRTALALVARAEMPIGVVYRTDAMAEPKVRVVYTVPDDQHSPIVYPAAALTDAGKVFLKFLQTDESMDIFAAYGFAPVKP